MTQEDLFLIIEKNGLIPVPVRREGTTEEALDSYDGDLTSFLSTAKAIGARAVYVTGYRLEEERFLYAFEDKETDDEAEAEEVDLTDFSPALAKYKSYLGEIYWHFLVAKGGAADLCLSIDQAWVADFENEVERAEGMAVLGRYKKSK